jgi:5-methyltetrahydropteroyltriglutamate--homocysteine methyltransferase
MLTTHSGSLPRPKELFPLLLDKNNGVPVDPDIFEPLLRSVIKDIVRQQADVGLDVVNDGEESRIAYASHLGSRLSGFELDKEIPAHREMNETSKFPEFFARSLTHGDQGLRHWRCVGPIEWKDFSEVERDLQNLKNAVADVAVEDVFVTAPSPTRAAQRQPNGGYYDTWEDFEIAMADIMKREYKAIVDAGFVPQVDGPASVQHQPDFRAQLAHEIEVINYALADIPADMARIHFCHGSGMSPHTLDPDLADIVDILLTCKANGITLVASSPRHQHEWQVWEDVKLPEGKVIIPGVIDHTTNIVEHPKTVAERIIRFASVLGRENMIAGVDCGYAPTAGQDLERVDARVMWAKFRSLTEGARIATKALWS